MPWRNEIKPFHGTFDPMKDDHCAFKISDGGKQYVVDANHPYAELYPDVPDEVCRRVEEALDSAEAKHPELGCVDIDPTPFYEEALKAEFDEVEFLGTDFVPGAIY